MDVYNSFFVSSLFMSFAYVSFEYLVFFSLLVPGKKHTHCTLTHTHHTCTTQEKTETCHLSYLLCVPMGSHGCLWLTAKASTGVIPTRGCHLPQDSTLLGGLPSSAFFMSKCNSSTPSWYPPGFLAFPNQKKLTRDQTRKAGKVLLESLLLQVGARINNRFLCSLAC